MVSRSSPKIEFELANGPKGSDYLGSNPLKSDFQPTPHKQLYISNSSGLEYSQSNPQEPSASLNPNILSESKMGRPGMGNSRPGKNQRESSGGLVSGGFNPQQQDEMGHEFVSDSQMMQGGMIGMNSGSHNQQLIDLEGFSPFQSELVSDSRLEGLDFQQHNKPSQFQQQAYANLSNNQDYDQEFEFGMYGSNIQPARMLSRRPNHTMAASSPAPMMHFNSPVHLNQVIMEESHGAEVNEDDPDHDQLDLDDLPTAPMPKAKAPQQHSEHFAESGPNQFGNQEAEFKGQPGVTNSPNARQNSFQVSDSLIDHSAGGLQAALLKDAAGGISRRGWNMKGFHPAKPVEISVRQFYGNPEGFPEVLIDPYAFEAESIYDKILQSNRYIKESGNHKTYQVRLPAHPQLKYFG